MERGDWENDPDYPVAPLPAHERTWRHPSEIGASQWVQTEPPLVVGRGLSVATGTVGAILALGLLWLMIPHRNGGVAAEASTTTAHITPTRVATSVIAARITTASIESEPPVASVGTVAATTTSPPATTAATVATTTRPSVAATPPTAAPTVTSAPPATLVLGVQTVARGPAVAVALAPGRLVVTTAAAVRGREGFTVQLRSGAQVNGAVVWVDQQLGVAVLAVPVDVGADMQASQVDSSAGNFTLLAKRQTPAVLSTDAVGTQVQFDSDADASEGSLVVDADGRLVGMVTMSDAGIYLVGVDSLMNAYNAASTAAAVPAWLGVHVEVGPAGDLTVKRILDGGPAATAGIQVGDVIRAVDGTAVTDVDSLRAAVTSHAPGEMVTLSILHPDTAQPVDVQVTLSQQPL